MEVGGPAGENAAGLVRSSGSDSCCGFADRYLGSQSHYSEHFFFVIFDGCGLLRLQSEKFAGFLQNWSENLLTNTIILFEVS